MNEEREISKKQIQQIFINELQAYRIADVVGPNNSCMQMWAVEGRVVVTQLFADGGWEYYLQGKEQSVAHVANNIREYFKMENGNEKNT